MTSFSHQLASPERPLDPPHPGYTEQEERELADARDEFFFVNHIRARETAFAEDLVEAIAEHADEIAAAYRAGLSAPGAIRQAIDAAVQPYIQARLQEWWEAEERERFGREHGE